MWIEVLKIIVWPLAIIILAVLFRKPIHDRIQSMRGIEYLANKDGKKRVRVSFIETSLRESKEILELPEALEQEPPQLENPKQTIMEAWHDLERSAERKVAELGIDYKQNGFKNTALVYLELRGCFPPKTETAMQNLKMLRNQIAHYPTEAISNIDANEYLRVTEEIKKTIDAIHGVPAVQLNAIAMIMRNLASVIDGGKYNHVTISEVHKHIEEETILDFIASMEGAQELKGILGSDLWKGFDRFYTKSLKSIYYGYAGNERRKWGIENSGLCLVMAWTIEIIQMGSGWHPNENLSEL